MERTEIIHHSVFSNQHFFVCIHRSGRVACRAELELPLPASAAWGELRDFRRSASHDFFHCDIRIEGGVPRRGAGLVLEHRFGPFRARRVGRILRWREWGDSEASGNGSCKAAGYSFSDLSAAGPRAGFPHVLSYHLQASPRGTCRLAITVGGLWTARLVPRWAARLWLAWVFHHVVASVRNQLLAAAVSAPMRKRATHDSGHCS